MNNTTGWSNTVSLEGIDRAIDALGYRNRQSPKYRLVDALRHAWAKSPEPGAKGPVSADDLIRILWDIPNDVTVPVSRRRNLSSLRSSVNADLTALYRSGENPEGVIIDPDYMFTICDEAKDKALADLQNLARGGGPDLQKIEEVLKVVQAALGDREKPRTGSYASDTASIEAIRDAIRGLAEEFGVSGVGKEVLYREALEEACEDVEVVDDAGEEAVIVEEDVLEDEAGEEESSDLEGDVEEVLCEEGLEETCEDVEVVDDAGEEAVIVEEDVLEDEAGEEESPDLEGDVEEVLCGEGLEETCEDVEVVDDAGEEAVIVEEDVLEDEAEEDESPDLEEDVEEVLCGEDDLEEDYEDVEGEDEAQGEDSGSGLVHGELNESEGLDGNGPLDPEKARLLAETFNDSLSAMDRFFNQHILVPRGTYRVRAPSSNGGAPGEIQVDLPDFFIGKFPVTNAVFEVFVEKTGYRTRAERTGYGMVYHGRYRRCVDERNGKETLTVRSGIVCTRVEGACWYRPSGPGSTLRNKRNHPVVQVSLEDAMAFAAWTGKRLPTEEEWEGAMRTADGNLLPWGDAWECDACNIEESWIGDTSPVDQFLTHANPLGLADGVGNVLEWTMTVDGEDDLSMRVAKGSSWIAGNSINLASRIALPRDTSSNILGIRCVAY